MQKTILIFISMLFGYLPCKSQNVVELYYNTINKADSFLYLNNDSANALKFYTKALSNWEVKPSVIKTEYWLITLTLAVKSKNDNLARIILTNFILNGLHKELYKFYKSNNKSLTVFFNTAYCKQIERSYDSLFKVYLNKIDYDFESEIFSLCNQDKFSREIYLTPNIYNYADSNALNNIFELIYLKSDCDIKLRVRSILRSINTSSANNYSKTISGVVFLLLHNLRNFDNLNIKNNYCLSDTKYYNEIQPLLLDFVKSGILENNEYAYLIDRANCWNNFNDRVFQIYGTHFEDGKLMYPIFDIENVDKRRAEIFLPSLYQASVIEGFELPKEYVYKK